MNPKWPDMNGAAQVGIHWFALLAPELKNELIREIFALANVAKVSNAPRDEWRNLLWGAAHAECLGATRPARSPWNGAARARPSVKTISTRHGTRFGKIGHDRNLAALRQTGRYGPRAVAGACPCTPTGIAAAARVHQSTRSTRCNGRVEPPRPDCLCLWRHAGPPLRDLARRGWWRRQERIDSRHRGLLCPWASPPRRGRSLRLRMLSINLEDSRSKYSAGSKPL
jgi:hypothetical protein